LSAAENIDPASTDEQYAYCENAGWINAEPLGDSGPGVEVLADKLIGWMYGENIGWISMSCENTASCGTVAYGVTNDEGGHLHGYAWSENTGWISMSCENTGSCDSVYYGVTIDSFGNFKGFAHGENIGWVHFQGTGSVNYQIKTGWTFPCIVNLDDFGRFAQFWLANGVELPSDLTADGQTDPSDTAQFSTEWLNSCPENWSL
jgi:hypothetical protein